MKKKLKMSLLLSLMVVACAASLSENARACEIGKDINPAVDYVKVHPFEAATLCTDIGPSYPGLNLTHYTGAKFLVNGRIDQAQLSMVIETYQANMSMMLTNLETGPNPEDRVNILTLVEDDEHFKNARFMVVPLVDTLGALAVKHDDSVVDNYVLNATQMLPFRNSIAFIAGTRTEVRLYRRTELERDYH